MQTREAVGVEAALHVALEHPDPHVAERANRALEQDVIAARLECTACARGWEIELPVFRCPTCGGADVAIAAGDELEVESIEVEEEPACTA